MPIAINPNYIPGNQIPQIVNAIRDIGDDSYTPFDVRKLRRSVWGLMRRVGTPVLIKHRYSDLDVRAGVAQPIGTQDSTYFQSRNTDPLSFGTGYASVALSPNEWYSPAGDIVVANVSPGANYVQAPLYRGFGQGTLCYVIFPDAVSDYLKVDTGGPVFKVQESQTIAPWMPKIWDGDLLIEVTVDQAFNIVSTENIYEAKNVQQITMRGWDRRGKPEVPLNPDFQNNVNRFTINARFDSVLLPFNDSRYAIQTDR